MHYSVLDIILTAREVSNTSAQAYLLASSSTYRLGLSSLVTKK
jgi:hypothetical protein